MVSFAPALHAQASTGESNPPAVQAVTLMVKNEIAYHRSSEVFHPFRFLSIERSSRTSGHLWTEEVVEVDGGLLRRLLAVDGKPLNPQQTAAEEHRLERIAADPSEFQRMNRSREDDEARMVKMLAKIPREFLFQNEGQQNGCERIAFRPNPGYQPQSFEDRVVYNMAGTIEIAEPQMRVCSVEAHLTKTVEFGFGLLGHVSQGSGFSLQRMRVEPSVWRSTHITMHFDGSILFFKSISRSQKTARQDFQPVPAGLTLKEAVALSRQDDEPLTTHP